MRTGLIATGVIAFIALAAAIGTNQGVTTTEAALQDRPVVEQALRQVHIGGGSAGKVEIKAAGGRSYSMTLWYPEGAVVTQGTPETDARAIVRAILAALVASGRRPATESVHVWVSAMQHARGATGEAKAYWFGNPFYDYNRDAIEYEACTAKGWLGC